MDLLEQVPLNVLDCDFDKTELNLRINLDEDIEIAIKQALCLHMLSNLFIHLMHLNQATVQA